MDTSTDRSAPAACALPLADLPGRMAEWDALIAESVDVAGVGRGRVRLTLDRARTSPAAVADLAGREAQCCSFLTFELTVGERELTLEVTADAGHEEALDVLVRRAQAVTERTHAG